MDECNVLSLGMMNWIRIERKLSQRHRLHRFRIVVEYFQGVCAVFLPDLVQPVLRVVVLPQIRGQNVARAHAVHRWSDLPGSVFEPSQFLQGPLVPGMSRRCVLGSLLVHLEDPIPLVLGQVVVRAVRFPIGRIGIDGQQKGRRATEDLVVLHSQIGLLEIHAERQRLDGLARAHRSGGLLCRSIQNGRQSHVGVGRGWLSIILGGVVQRRCDCGVCVLSIVSCPDGTGTYPLSRYRYGYEYE
mmetsp:Transcript_19747/g.55117  ORF Transcript_19747/g.55117 Transcript_19747/m.55117 type:complete len:243 (-) Transcript_19747:8-736(-)